MYTFEPLLVNNLYVIHQNILQLTVQSKYSPQCFQYKPDGIYIRLHLVPCLEPLQLKNMLASKDLSFFTNKL